MARYDSLTEYYNGKYNSDTGLYNHDPGFFSTAARNIDAGSQCRTDIAQAMQWVTDNGLELDPEAKKNFEEFYKAVASANAEGDTFGNNNEGKIGNMELASMGFMLNDLSALRSSGRISSEELADKLNEMFSDETMQAIREGEQADAFVDLAEDIDGLQNLEAGQYDMSDMPYGRRAVINELSDYQSAALGRYPTPEGETAPDPAERCDQISDLLEEAQRKGYINDEQYRDMRSYMRSLDENSAPSAMLYAAKDVMAMMDGNPDDPENKARLDQLFSKDGMEAVRTGSDEGLAFLSDLDFAVTNVGVNPPDVDNLTYGGNDGPEPGKYAILTTEEGRDMVFDKLSGEYFAAHAEMTQGEYIDLLDEYLAGCQGMSGADFESYAERFNEDHPGFTDAHDYMVKLDTYLDGAGSVADRSASQGLDVDAELEGYFTRLGEISESGKAVCDEIMATAEEMGKEPVPEGPAEDYDASVEDIDRSILTQQSPIERFEAMRDAAVDVWAGTYGNGQSRVNALQEAGFSPDECKRIQEMVDHGREWCASLDMDKYDQTFPSPDGKTLADQETEFRSAQLESAGNMMTYENAEEYRAAYNEGLEDGEQQMTAKEAEDAYGAAYNVLQEAGGVSLADAAAKADAEANMERYEASHPDPEPEGENPGPEDPGPDFG